MRIAITFLLLLIATTVTLSQTDMPGNSFEATYKKSNPTIHYGYDSKKQIHDYSGNWDFDKDGRKDKVYFVGTGGAHLYYFLRVILSSDNKTRDFPFIQSDFPVLPTDEELKRADFKPGKGSLPFVVYDHCKDNNLVIFVKLDNASFEAEKKELKKKGVKSSLVVIGFKDGKTVFHDLGD